MIKTKTELSNKKRKVDILVLSDLHVGTLGCRSNELLQYLESIEPSYLILNGDIIDMWQLNKRYFPAAHFKIIKYFIDLISRNVPVIYITGNHDEMLRKFNGLRIGSFSIQNKLVLELNGNKHWIFHGDVFDVVMQYSKWLARLGSVGYDILILINTLINKIWSKLGKGRISFSKKIKKSVKTAVKYINDFENTAATIAINNNYQYVICGHIHQPVIKCIKMAKGEVIYMNPGDWVENMTALEYVNGKWSLFEFKEEDEEANVNSSQPNKNEEICLTSRQLYMKILNELKITINS